MSLNSTPTADRIHIGLFGKRNAGKSSVINAITDQQTAIVSDVRGTTTDPVYKTMELLPLGPVVFIDTPGLDDDSVLGKKRIEQSLNVLNKTNIALIVVDPYEKDLTCELDIIDLCKKKDIPYILVLNKIDLKPHSLKVSDEIEYVEVSAKTHKNIDKLKEKIAKIKNIDYNENPLLRDLISKNDMVLLVVPIDKSAPKGRLILPQQQVIREILDKKGLCFIAKQDGVTNAFESLKQPPKLVITDSQVFDKVSKLVPVSIPLTSFSILFARKKGILKSAVKSVKEIENLKDNDIILISEGCTHHRQCDDIGRVKIPNMIKKYTNKHLEFEFTSGNEYKRDLKKYKMIIHCGGCMLSQKEMAYRLNSAKAQEVCFVNYGILIAYINGILKRSVSLFSEINDIL